MNYINILDNFKKAWHTRVEKESEIEEVKLPCKRKQLYDLTDSSDDEGIIQKLNSIFLIIQLLHILLKLHICVST